MAGYIEAMHDRMWRWAYPEHADALDGVTRPNGPPVFKRETATHNVPVPEDGSKARAILSTVPPGKRHRWFRSTKSSQALAQGVFGALIAYDRLDVLAGVAAECGRPAFYADAAGWSLTLEHTVTTLAEPRPTSVDVLARGPGGCVAVECKLTEHDFGKCSRTHGARTGAGRSATGPTGTSRGDAPGVRSPRSASGIGTTFRHCSTGPPTGTMLRARSGPPTSSPATRWPPP